MKWTCEIAAALCLVVPLPVASAATFTVAPGGSIQDAVDAALANADDADLIRVSAGNYDEDVIVDYTGSNQVLLTIQAIGDGNHVIEDGLLVRLSRLVTVIGFTIGSPPGDDVAPITVRDSVGFALLDSRTTSGDDGGLDAEDTFEVIVDRCVFNNADLGAAGTGFGVRIVGGTGHLVRRTTCNNNEAGGILVEADASLIRQCTVRQTGPDTSSEAVHVDGFNNIVQQCVIEDNEGIGIAATGVCEIHDNEVNDNGRIGIRYGTMGVLAQAGGVIRDNDVDGNGSFGIVVRDDQSGVDVFGNVADDNEGANIRILGDRNSVHDNVARNSQSGGGSNGDGIIIESVADGNFVAFNKTKDNDGQGIQVDGDLNYVLLNKVKGSDGIAEGAGATGNEGRGNTTKGGANAFP